MKIKIVVSLVLLFSILWCGYGQEDACFEGVNKKLLDWAFKDYETPTMAREAKMQIVRDLVGCDMPDFEARTLTGDTLNPDNLKGKITVVNFWFIGCPPCENELPGLNRLVEEYEGKPVNFLAFGRDDEEEIVEYLNAHDFKYQQIPQTNAPGIFLAFEVRFGYPYHLVFNADGQLVYTRVGGSLNDELFMYNKLKPVLDKLLN